VADCLDSVGSLTSQTYTSPRPITGIALTKVFVQTLSLCLFMLTEVSHPRSLKTVSSPESTQYARDIRFC
jgi:hypothetical protein